MWDTAAEVPSATVVFAGGKDRCHGFTYPGHEMEAAYGRPGKCRRMVDKEYFIEGQTLFTIRRISRALLS